MRPASGRDADGERSPSINPASLVEHPLAETPQRLLVARRSGAERCACASRSTGASNGSIQRAGREIVENQEARHQGDPEPGLDGLDQHRILFEAGAGQRIHPRRVVALRPFGPCDLRLFVHQARRRRDVGGRAARATRIRVQTGTKVRPSR
jgi:hypothetical protein